MTAALVPIKPSENTDNFLPVFIRAVNANIVSNNDDCFFLLVGDTGSGKSMLSLHMYEAAVSNPVIEQFAFDPSTMAQAMKNILSLPRGDRFLLYDEAYVSSRNSLSKFNKDVLELYSKIRGENVFHLWSTPSAQQIDKAILFERVKAVFYVFTKSVNAPRLYACFNRGSIKRIYEKHGNVELTTLQKCIMSHADYIGAFRDYKGVLRSAYDEFKSQRQGAAINDFADKYLASAGKSVADLVRLFGQDDHTIRVRIKGGISSGDLLEGRDYVVKGTRTLYLPSGVDYIKDALRKKPNELKGSVNSLISSSNSIIARKGKKISKRKGVLYEE